MQICIHCGGWIVSPSFERPDPNTLFLVCPHCQGREPFTQYPLWWISGGNYGLMSIGMHYCGGSFEAAWHGGMDAVVALEEWRESIESNLSNRQRILERGRMAFTISDALLKRRSGSGSRHRRMAFSHRVSTGGKAGVVILEGTAGASVARDRNQGFMDAIKNSPNIKILEE